MSEWREVALGEVCKDVQYGLTAKATEGASGPLFLRITDIVPPQLNWATVPRCEAPSEETSRFGLKDGDIVVARTGATVGYAKFLRNPPPDSVFASYLVRFQVREGISAEYVGHVVQSGAYKAFVRANAGGAAQPNASAKVLGGFPVPLPCLRTQRRIAAVLSAFDEQIEINERRIALLDGVAQATYHNWFPFIPGEPNWPAVPFSQAADFVNGFAFKPPHHSSAGRPIIKIKELKGGVTPSTPRNSGDGIPRKYCVEPGDLLFSWSADLGVYLWPGEPGLLNQHLFLVEPRDGFTREFLFHAIDESLPAFRSRAQGTTMRHIKRSALDEVLVQSPSQEVMDEFTEAVKPVHQETLVLANTNRQLAATRDLLLPRLVTGRLDISEVDLRVLEPAEAG